MHVNVTIACKENGVPSNVQSRLDHCNCLEMKTHQPQHDGIVEKWTQFVDSVMRKCGLKNDWQS